MKLDTLHRMHARHLVALQRSPATSNFYRFALEPLGKFLHEQDLEPDADLVTRGLLQEFQLCLRTSRGMQSGGEHTVMRSLRATFRWVREEERIARDPTAKLRLPTLPQPLRNRALLCLYDTGLRLGEVIALRVEDVNMETGLITVRTETAKRQKARVVPMGVKTAKAMNAYERKERRPVVPHVREMFLSRTGEPMTRGVLTHLMCKVASTAGLPRPHCTARLAPRLCHPVPAERRGHVLAAADHGAYLAGDGAALCSLPARRPAEQAPAFNSGRPSWKEAVRCNGRGTGGASTP